MLFIEMNENFGIGMRIEAVPARFQLMPQLHVIEDLAIENDPDVAILVMDRLLAAGEVDDAQTGMGQSDATVKPDAAAVGAAVMKPADHRRQFGMHRRPASGRCQDAGNAAHDYIRPSAPFAETTASPESVGRGYSTEFACCEIMKYLMGAE